MGLTIRNDIDFVSVDAGPEADNHLPQKPFRQVADPHQAL
jgi:hypothetical protein